MRPDRFAAFALAAALVAFAPAAVADDDVDATSLRVEALSEDAFARASRGAYAEAVELYLQAHAALPAAPLAFDIALLYDKHLAAPALALAWYRRTAASADVTPDLASVAGERIAALEAASKTAAGSGASRGALEGDDAHRDRASRSTWTPLHTTAVVAGGAGLVALGIATGFAIVAKNKDSQAGQYCDGDRCTDARAITLTDEARAAATVANVAVVTGAALVAGGVTLWLLAPRRGAVDVSVRATSAAGFGGAALAPSFVLGGVLP
ncbi:MAG: putative rane protein [Myxococcaceae bacterium]|nr:putative rane protein [Myxococcaceae bacterium]